MTTEQKRGWFASLMIGSWNLVNFTRRLVVNVIFLILLILFIMALRSGNPVLRQRTTLVLDPKGSIVEQYTAAPAQRAFGGVFGNAPKEVQLRDLIDVIDAAAADTHIERLVIVPDEIESAGFSTLREIGAAIERFKTSGKEVIAVASGMTQGHYYLAAHADQILLDPQGAVLLEGLGRYRSYYKELLDRLGVVVHLFRVGEYKSAAEPYVRNDSSPEAKEADLYWMNGVWGDYLKDIAAARKLDAAQLAHEIQDYPSAVKAAQGDLAQLALQEKLVDRLATRDEARALLIEKGVKDDKSFRRVEFDDYLRVVQRDRIADMRAPIAVVIAEGEIVGGDPEPGTIGGDTLSRQIRQAREDDSIKASEFTRRRGVRIRADPARSGTHASGGQAGDRIDGRRRGVGRLLDFNERKPHFRRARDDHRFDRHFRHVREHSRHAGEDRRAHRRRGHNTVRGRVRCAPSARP